MNDHEEAIVVSHRASPIIYYVTGFWKTDQIVTLGLFHFIGAAIVLNTTYTQCH